MGGIIMNEELLRKIEEGNFGNNKYYIEIIKEFINSFPQENMRIVLEPDHIYLKIKDLSGIKIVLFTLSDNNIKIKMDKTVNYIKYQDIIVYDEYGVMVERTNSWAEIKNDVNKKFRNNESILASELDSMGEIITPYTGMVFKTVDSRKIKRPENYGLEGNYVHKSISFDSNAKLSGREIEGSFDVLNGNSIITLDFPLEEDVKVTRDQLLIDNNNIYSYQDIENKKNK